MTALRVVLGDQLSRGLSSLEGADPARDVVLMVEVAEEATYVPHHPQKIIFLFSAMRHFAEELRASGFTVDYVTLDAPGNTGSFRGEVHRAIVRNASDRVVVTEPGEHRVRSDMETWQDAVGVPVDILEDDRFLCSHARFREWAGGRKTLRMEWFYREMRKETGILMEAGEPAGGQWNFDADNRKRLPDRQSVPSVTRIEPDAVTRTVIALVRERFGEHFGDAEPFGWAVTRADALSLLNEFIEERLPNYGDYQDAMRPDTPFVFHAVLSPYLNAGLLDPREVVEAAVAAWERGSVPLNAVEGFVRQILGWREYIRGIYWLEGPDYGDGNFFGDRRKLPWFYWSGETDMACLADAIGQTRRHGYAHHIQRLMVTGNFALLAGVDPRQVARWYLAVYVDAYEWVELPNVHGMAMFADGGRLASKPYVSSGKYIDRMSGYCRGCRYDPKVVVGEKACPFNALYWHFLDRNRAVLKDNQRMGLAYRNLDRMTPERRAETLGQAERFLADLK